MRSGGQRCKRGRLGSHPLRLQRTAARLRQEAPPGDDESRDGKRRGEGARRGAAARKVLRHASRGDSDAVLPRACGVAGCGAGGSLCNGSFGWGGEAAVAGATPAPVS